MRALAFCSFIIAVSSLAAADSQSLFSAIRTGKPAAVKAELRAGADKDAPGEFGVTPLIYSVTTAGVPVMRVLLDAGAAVNTANANGITPLHAAAFDIAKVRLLLERGANVNAATANDETPLFVACDRAGNHEVVSLLLARGANPSAGAGTVNTALNRAAANGDVAIMRLLLSKGAKLGTVDARSVATHIKWLHDERLARWCGLLVNAVRRRSLTTIFIGSLR